MWTSLTLLHNFLFRNVRELYSLQIGAVELSSAV